jgi:hypothetical protein
LFSCSILCFHDAIDLFNQLAAEYLRKTDTDKKLVSGGKRTNLFMMEYFDLIPELTLKPSVKKINDRRNTLKHNGEIPSDVSIEESKITSKLFFEENTEKIFGLNFHEISLLNLIESQTVKKLLQEAESCLCIGQFSKCADEAAKAFNELTYIDDNDYHGERYGYHIKNRFRVPSLYRVRNFDKNLERLFEVYNDNFQSINETLLIISLGVDYRRYVKFEVFTPKIHRAYGPEKYIVYNNRRSDKLNYERCRFLIDFVLDCALKIQAFDY